MKLIRVGAFVSELIFQAELVSNSYERLMEAVDDFDKTAVWLEMPDIVYHTRRIKFSTLQHNTKI